MFTNSGRSLRLRQYYSYWEKRIFNSFVKVRTSVLDIISCTKYTYLPPGSSVFRLPEICLQIEGWWYSRAGTIQFRHRQTQDVHVSMRLLYVWHYPANDALQFACPCAKINLASRLCTYLIGSFRGRLFMSRIDSSAGSLQGRHVFEEISTSCYLVKSIGRENWLHVYIPGW